MSGLKVQMKTEEPVQNVQQFKSAEVVLLKLAELTLSIFPEGKLEEAAKDAFYNT